MMQLYDREEIMRMHDFDVAVRATVETYQDCDMDFKDVINRISNRFQISRERAEEMAGEYWEE